MKYNLYVTHNKYVNKFRYSTKFDVSTLVSGIEYFTSLEAQAGKLTFTLERDPNNLLELSEGDLVEFVVNEHLLQWRVFKGYIFTLGTDSTEAYQVTAYDQTRYLKNKDTMVVGGKDSNGIAHPMTLNNLFDDICKRNNITNKTSKVISNYFLPDTIYQDRSYYDILNEGIMDTLVNSPAKQYFCIYDNFGILTLDEISNMRTNYIIGDDSLLTDYQYEVDIDNDTYNKVKIVRTDKDGKKSVDVLVQDEESINKIGVLRTIMNADATMSNKQIVQKANLFLSLKKNATKKITLNAIGVPNIIAGSGFLLQLKKLNISAWMYVISATHHYDVNNHTMELEVSGLPKDREIKLIGE